jgi:nucleotide-binding universal stress UspA family protein
VAVMADNEGHGRFPRISDCLFPTLRAWREMMIKDVMVRLDGTAADEVRLTVANDIADHFQSHVIGLFLNVLPVVIAAEDGIGATRVAELLQKAREAGDTMEARLTQRLAVLQKPMELRRFDILNDAAGDVAAREARAADTFVALRPNGAPQEPEHLIESVLFGSGRHILLVPNRKRTKVVFDRILVAWNGTRESARALAEALPYLRKTQQATVVVVDDEPPAEAQAMLGKDAVNHLNHHGIKVALHRARLRDHDVGATLIAEARRLKADLIVMGGYGHSRLREWLLGGATYELLHKAPVPLLIAH